LTGGFRLNGEKRSRSSQLVTKSVGEALLKLLRDHTFAIRAGASGVRLAVAA